MGKRAVMLGCLVMLTFSSPQSRASSDEFVGTMTSHVLGFAMLAEQFAVGPCSKHLPNPSALRIYSNAKSKVLALLSPRLRREMQAGFSKNPRILIQSAEQMLTFLNQLPAGSERETCLGTAATINAMYHASFQIFQEYATMVGIK
jgi:hypothetical protein